MQAEQPFLVARLGKLVDEAGRRDEADGQTALTGCKAKPDRQMRLACA